MESTRICEHSVKQKIEGKWIAMRAGLIALYLFLPLLFTFTGLVQKNFLPFLVVSLLVDLPIIFLTWRKTVLEYEYSMTGGVLTFSRIYGGTSRSIVFEIGMDAVKAAFPYGSEAGRKRLTEYAPEVQYFALATQDEESNAQTEIWCCLFEGEDGKHTAFYFELTDTAYKFLRSYAGGVTSPRARQSEE